MLRELTPCHGACTTSLLPIDVIKEIYHSQLQTLLISIWQTVAPVLRLKPRSRATLGWLQEGASITSLVSTCLNLSFAVRRVAATVSIGEREESRPGTSPSSCVPRISTCARDMQARTGRKHVPVNRLHPRKSKMVGL